MLWVPWVRFTFRKKKKCKLNRKLFYCSIERGGICYCERFIILILSKKKKVESELIQSPGHSKLQQHTWNRVFVLMKNIHSQPFKSEDFISRLFSYKYVSKLRTRKTALHTFSIVDSYYSEKNSNAYHFEYLTVNSFLIPDTLHHFIYSDSRINL